MLFSVIYYILLGLTEIIKFLFGHFFAVNIYSYIMKQKFFLISSQVPPSESNPACCKGNAD